MKIREMGFFNWCVQTKTQSKSKTIERKSNYIENSSFNEKKTQTNFIALISQPRCNFIRDKKFNVNWPCNQNKTEKKRKEWKCSIGKDFAARVHLELIINAFRCECCTYVRKLFAFMCVWGAGIFHFCSDMLSCYTGTDSMFFFGFRNKNEEWDEK